MPTTSKRSKKKKDVRSLLLQVPMSPNESKKLEKIAKTLGWSRASIVRWGLDNLDIEKMRESAPSGNRRL